MKDHNFISDTIVANHHLLLLGWYHASVSTSTRCIIGTRTLSPSNIFKYTGNGLDARKKNVGKHQERI